MNVNEIKLCVSSWLYEATFPAGLKVHLQARECKNLLRSEKTFRMDLRTGVRFPSPPPKPPNKENPKYCWKIKQCNGFFLFSKMCKSVQESTFANIFRVSKRCQNKTGDSSLTAFLAFGGGWKVRQRWSNSQPVMPQGWSIGESNQRDTRRNPLKSSVLHFTTWCEQIPYLTPNNLKQRITRTQRATKRATTKRKYEAGINIDHAFKFKHRRLHEARGAHKGW